MTQNKPETDSHVTDLAKPAKYSSDTTFAKIVTAFAARDSATVDEIIELASKLSKVLKDMREPVKQSSGVMGLHIPTVSAEENEPAIPIEDSVTHDKVYCLCCGRGFTMLKRHLKAEHGLSENEYRSRFNLPEDFPLVAPDYSERKASYAKEHGFGKYPRLQTSL